MNILGQNVEPLSANFELNLMRHEIFYRLTLIINNIHMVYFALINCSLKLNSTLNPIRPGGGAILPP